MTQIKFNPYENKYELSSHQSVTLFDSKEEAEFFYVNRYIDYRVSSYSDYKIKYCNDGKTIKQITLDKKKLSY